MEKVILKAQERNETGKKVAKDLRLKGLIPANVYKATEAAVNLQIVKTDLNEVLHTKAGTNVIITLKIEGKKDKTVVIKELQREPLRGEILHIDFHEISLTEAIKVDVPLTTKGDPEGVKKDGGILEHVLWQLHVECLPTAIPEKIEIDVTHLGISQPIFVKDIVVPEGVKVLNDPELIVVIVKPPKAEVAKEETAAEGAAEPELIRKKKEEESPEEGAAPAAKEGEKKA